MSRRPDRRDFLTTAGGMLATAVVASESSLPAFELDGVGVADLAAGLADGTFTARHLVEKYLARIAAIDRAGPTLRAVIETNPDALDIADRLDAERKKSGPRGPMHGIPVLLKDNIATADRMQTTAGSLALVGAKPSSDAFLVQRLRRAGAVILGKTNLSEWANFRSSNSTSGWSARGGLTKNPHVLDRNPSGSSSGSAVAAAASLAAVTVGTETNGSIVSPAGHCGVVGLKPTVGLVSRTGVIPISHTQDTAGPMTRTVRDAAILLAAMTGPDPVDPTTTGAKVESDYTRCLDPNGLSGARIGVVRKYFGFDDSVDARIDEAIKVMADRGAVIVDPVGGADFCRFGANAMTVMLYEFKAGLNGYLGKLGPDSRVKNLADVIAFNKGLPGQEMPFFGQDLFDRAEACVPLTDQTYRDALAACRRISRTEGIDRVMDEHRLDALVAPTNGPAPVSDLLYSGQNDGGGGCSSPAAVSGYPHITVPAGWVHGLPIGLSFFGRAWSEPRLLTIAYSFEQSTRRFQRPAFLPYLECGGT